jgi:signal transduction histidine kinase
VAEETRRTGALTDFRAGFRDGLTEPPTSRSGRLGQAALTAAVDVAMSLLLGLLLVRDTSFLPEEAEGWIVAGLLLAPGVVQRLWIGMRWPTDSGPDNAKLWIKFGALVVTLLVARIAVSEGIPPTLASGAVASRLIGLTAYQHHRPPAFFWGLAGGVVMSTVGFAILGPEHHVSLFSGRDASIGTVVRDLVALLAVVTAFGIIGAQTRRESEEAARIEHALAAERARIARELHDVVAHQMTGVILQAQGAASVIDADPRRATVALRSIEEGSRSALVEMRRLLGVLREGESAVGAEVTDERRGAPQPTLDGITDLIRSYSRSTSSNPDDRDLDDFDPEELLARGREPDEVGRTVVRLSISDGAHAAPAGLQASAHRIVQEAFTNIARHVGRASVDVDVRVAAEDLVVRVVNGRAVEPPVAQVTGAGLGLLGMRERAEALGGTLHAGPTDDGGWEVEAVLPLHTASASSEQTDRP